MNFIKSMHCWQTLLRVSYSEFQSPLSCIYYFTCTNSCNLGRLLVLYAIVAIAVKYTASIFYCYILLTF